MARKRVTTTAMIKTREELDQALREVGDIKRQIGAITADMNKSINQDKVAAKQKSAALAHRLAFLESAMADWGERSKKELFTDRRSLNLTFGLVGFRRSAEIKPALRCTWEDVLAKLKELNFMEVIRTKQEVDRDALRDWSSETLEQVSARRVEKDVFWYEVKEEVLKDAA